MHSGTNHQPTTTTTSPFGAVPHPADQRTRSHQGTAMRTTQLASAATHQNAHISTTAQNAAVPTPHSCAAPSQQQTPHVPVTTHDVSHATGHQKVVTPVKPEKLNRLLAGYQHRQYIIQGITEGFTLHFEGPNTPLISKNSPSIAANIGIARKKIQKELSLGRIAGPFQTPPFPNFKSSPLALREKSTPGKFRLLHNLSYPYDDQSVNFNISRQHTTVKYQTINQAILQIQQHSPAAYMAKSDISDAFRIIPVHPSQYHLLGFTIDNKIYYDKMLAMGAAPSCRIFESFSDAILWILQEKFSISGIVKVLDDFLFVHNDPQLCQHALNTFISLCQEIGVPIAHHKTAGPARIMIFLGIELDSIAMEARLPLDKLENYSKNVKSLSTQKSTTLRTLKSVIGQLIFATSVIPAGRAFLRRLHNLTIGKINPNATIIITKASQEDLNMWATFLAQHNGRTLIHYISVVTSTKINLCADSSKSGFGATYGKAWLQGTWPDEWKKLHISFLEMYPIYVTIALFAPKLRNSSITFHSDNMGVVHILNKQSSKCPFIMQLIRPLVLILLRYNIHLKSAHIPGVLNVLCDAISRQQVTPSLLAQYGADSTPTTLPQELLPANFKLNWEQL